MQKRPKSKITLIILSMFLIISVGLNVILLVQIGTCGEKIDTERDNSSGIGVKNFNKELVGTWYSGNNEIIISEDGSYVWTDYMDSDTPTIFWCGKGYISDNIIIITSAYSGMNKNTHYFSYEDIPEDEWQTGQKGGGYQIIFHGASFGLKTDSTITNYNFIKQ